MQLKFASFHKTKNGMVEPVCKQLNCWKEKGLGINTICCDNTVQNKALQLQSESAAWKLGIDYEFTARDTPEQNHLAEIAISNINSKGRVLMYCAHMPEVMKCKLFHDAWLMAVKLDGLKLVTIKGKMVTQYEHFLGKNPAPLSVG